MVAMALLGAAGPAAAQETIGARGVGGNVFSVTKPVMWSLPMFCVDQSNAVRRDCTPAATGTLKVSAATKAKYELPSTTVAKGGSVPCGESDCLRMTSTATVRARLKGVTSLPVTITVSLTSPVQEIMRKSVTLRTKNTASVVFQTSNLGGDAGLPGGRG